ncbi:hypothetical protein GCM10025861_19290 [Methanobacterium petrolearium]|nr:hypothetical protein GCM10025861_19290 [Methanobacterium petrolearium]
MYTARLIYYNNIGGKRDCKPKLRFPEFSEKLYTIIIKMCAVYV